MPLTWNEIRTRAHAFVHDWKDETREHAEAKSFWDAFFNVFGLSRRRVASFEEAVKKAGGGQGFIDLFWQGVLLVEHKSRGKDLEKARGQAFDYFPGLDEDQLPRYVLVSDFDRLRLFDLDEGTDVAFTLAELPSHLEHFGFIAGFEKGSYDEQDPVNVKAAVRMGELHDPRVMPSALAKAHRALDRAVDRAYRPQPFTTEANRVAFLFDRYEALTSALFTGGA